MVHFVSETAHVELKKLTSVSHWLEGSTAGLAGAFGGARRDLRALRRRYFRRGGGGGGSGGGRGGGGGDESDGSSSDEDGGGGGGRGGMQAGAYTLPLLSST